MFFILNNTAAQQKKMLNEKEYLALQRKIRINLNANIDSSFFYANQMAKSNNYKHLAFANGALSYLFQIKKNSKFSKEKYVLALHYMNKMPVSRDKIQMKSFIYNYAGLSEWKKGNYSKALENYQKGMKLSVEIEDIEQIFKFKANTALINEAVGNYQLAISNTRKLDEFLDENESSYTKEEFLNKKSNINTSLGSAYEGYFMKNHSKKYLLDSAEYFYKKAINYSHNFPENKGNASLSLGNIYNWKGDYLNAEKTYYDVIFFSTQNNLKETLCVANYNLADVYYTTKKYNKALIFFKKCDSIAAITNANSLDYLKSNYYQAKIYSILNKPELAYKHSKIYLENQEKFQKKLKEEAIEVNYKQGTEDLTQEIFKIEKKYKYEVYFNRFLKVFYGLLVFGIVFLVIKNKRDKKKSYQKMNALIEEFKSNLKQNENPEKEIESIEHEEITPKKENVNLNIDEEKENKIVEKLLTLENKLEYLNADFTLSYAAKKIKTNTTYLSYVVNKRFGKSFGEYSNELKINYVINQMITNPIYRKYSTQAIAESVGFKNAVSFAKSFRKRTGVSPAQFANNI